MLDDDDPAVDPVDDITPSAAFERQDAARLFRQRLAEAMQRAKLSQAQLAQRVGIDRSTLSQLLSAENDRLPRADTVAAIGNALQVSLDWLLGLRGEAELGAAILPEAPQVTLTPQSTADQDLARWHEEAAGYKIRYVPTSLPDLAKTDRVMEYEFDAYLARTSDQAIAASRDKLSYSRMPETDMEVCLPRQLIQGFALGEGVWRDLDRDSRLEQIDRMIRVFEELYPSLRLYMYDARSLFAVPYTVFGPVRAVVYVGQMYFVFNTTEHIRTLTRHFDDLVRRAVVHANETPDYLRQLRKAVV